MLFRSSLVFLIEPNSEIRLAHLESDACQILAYPPPVDLQKIMRSNKLKLLSQTGLNVGYLAYNTEKKPFDDVRVRRALNMAVKPHASKIGHVCTKGLKKSSKRRHHGSPSHTPHNSKPRELMWLALS